MKHLNSDGPANPAPIEESKTGRVYNTLRGRIRDLELLPGTPLQKEEIAAELGVSRAPVSEAITRLADEMLVDVRPRRGSFVAPIRPRDLRECMFIRTALEVEAVRRVALLGDEVLQRRLHWNLESQQAALDDDDYLRLYALDQAFHDLIMEPLDLDRTARLRASVAVPLDRPRQLALPAAERAAATLVEHRRILDGITVGDAAYAETAMRLHLARSAAAMEFGLAHLDAVFADTSQ